MKNRKLALALMLLSLTACQLSPAPQAPLVPAQQSAVPSGFFRSALVKRPLLLREEQGFRMPVAWLPVVSDFSVQQMAVAKPAIAPMYYYGGHDFNQYTIQFAEENIYPAAKGNTLLTVYNQSVQPLLAEWDTAARLIESRSLLNAQEPEYIQLPGSTGEPQKVMPRFVFRFASTRLKETLNVYVLEGEIRVHRMVWGENQINIAGVKIDSDQAVAIVRKAVANRSDQPGYTVYPDASSRTPEMKIIYSLPEKLVWQIQLNQQEGKKLRYFVSFFYGQGGGMPMPVPMVGVATPAMMMRALSTDTVVSSEGTTSSIAVGEPYPGRPVPQPEVESWSGSAEIDAVTGKLISLNRPVVYQAAVMPIPTPCVKSEDGSVSCVGVAVPGSVGGSTGSVTVGGSTGSNVVSQDIAP